MLQSFRSYRLQTFMLPVILWISCHRFGFGELSSLFSQVRPVDRTVFFKLRSWDLTLGEKESLFRAQWCMKGPKVLLPTLQCR